jgi:hypothetical protein
MDYKEKVIALLNNQELSKEQKEKLEEIFPELAESEDESIRKEIISIVKSYRESCITEGNHRFDNCISWLEKKCEQKPDKVEPKFKIGDWVIRNDIVGVACCIAQIHEPYYYLTNDHTFISFRKEDKYRLWTIQDAKDGDVLVCESGWTCIFKTLVNDETFSSYCFMDHTKWFCETGSESHTLNKEFMKAYNGEIKPATKEQQDLLFQKMNEKGYEWDAEKKKLKKISQEYPLTPDECIKSAWSEVDDNTL